MKTKMNGFTAQIELEKSTPPSGHTVVRVFDSNDKLIDVITGQYALVMSALRALHRIPKGRTSEVVR